MGDEVALCETHASREASAGTAGVSLGANKAERRRMVPARATKLVQVPGAGGFGW